MKYPIKIKTKESGLPYRRNYTKNSTVITIDEHFIKYHYVVECEHCDSDDGNGSWADSSPNWRITYNRSNVSGVGIHHISKGEFWQVTVYINGSNDDLTMHMESGEEAYDLFKQLEDLHCSFISGVLSTV